MVVGIRQPRRAGLFFLTTIIVIPETSKGKIEGMCIKKSGKRTAISIPVPPTSIAHQVNKACITFKIQVNIAGIFAKL